MAMTTERQEFFFKSMQDIDFDVSAFACMMDSDELREEFIKAIKESNMEKIESLSKDIYLRFGITLHEIQQMWIEMEVIIDCFLTGNPFVRDYDDGMVHAQYKFDGKTLTADIDESGFQEELPGILLSTVMFAPLS